ncbi:MAG: MSCRAMM family protein [Candidatus Saccharimonadales bacterium]
MIDHKRGVQCSMTIVAGILCAILASREACYVGGGNVRGEDIKLPKNVEMRDERRASSPVDLGDGGVIHGRVFDMSTGKPIAGAQLAAVEHVPGEGGYSLKELGQAITGDDGRYEMNRLKHDPGEVHVVAAGYAPRAVARDRQDLPIYRSIDVELAAEGSIAGRILDGDGQPMPGVTVGLTSVLAIDGRGYRSPTPSDAVTDAEGRFQLNDLPHGYAQLSYGKQGYYLSPMGDLMAVPGEPIEVAMQRTGAIRGKVVVKEGVPNRHIHLDQEGKRLGTWGGVGTWGGAMQVDAEGRFEFAGAPPGKYRVQFQGQTKVVTLVGGQTVDIEFE